MLNQEQSLMLDAAARKVAPCRNLLQELASFGGNCTTPEATLAKYTDTLKRVSEIDRTIEEMTPPSTPAIEKQIVNLMTTLEMLVKSCLALVFQLEADVDAARKDFLAASGSVLEAMQKAEDQKDIQLAASFASLTKELHAQFALKEKHLNLRLCSKIT